MQAELDQKETVSSPVRAFPTAPPAPAAQLTDCVGDVVGAVGKGHGAGGEDLQVLEDLLGGGVEHCMTRNHNMGEGAHAARTVRRVRLRTDSVNGRQGAYVGKRGGHATLRSPEAACSGACSRPEPAQHTHAHVTCQQCHRGPANDSPAPC